MQSLCTRIPRLQTKSLRAWNAVDSPSIKKKLMEDSQTTSVSPSTRVPRELSFSIKLDSSTESSKPLVCKTPIPSQHLLLKCWFVHLMLHLSMNLTTIDLSLVCRITSATLLIQNVPSLSINVPHFSANPRKPHAAAVKRIVAYLKETRDKGMVLHPFTSTGNHVDAYVDADFAGLYSHEDPQDPTSACSRTGFVIQVGENPVFWASRLQTEMADSTMAAEYIAASAAMKALIFLRHLHQDISSTLQLPFNPESNISTIFEDNQAALLLATADPPHLTPWSKTLSVKYHWFCEHLGPGKGILMKSIDSPHNRANIMTKPLTPELFKWECYMISGF